MSSYNPTAGIRNLGPHVECFDMKVKDYIKLGGQLATPTGSADHTALLYMDASDRLTSKINGNTASYFAMSSAASNTSPSFTGLTVTGNSALTGIIYTNDTLSGTTALTAADSGKIKYLNNVNGFTVTLPATSTSSGVFIKFIVKTAPTTDYIISAASGTPILGAALSVDLNGATDSNASNGSGVQTIHLVASKAKLGDCVELDCDGTNWYARVFTSGNFDAVTFA
jgi:uncharacterized protein YqkB